MNYHKLQYARIPNTGWTVHRIQHVHGSAAGDSETMLKPTDRLGCTGKSPRAEWDDDIPVASGLPISSPRFQVVTDTEQSLRWYVHVATSKLFCKRSGIQVKRYGIGTIDTALLSLILILFLVPQPRLGSGTMSLLASCIPLAQK